ncbi:hypothetical protein lerEdw1_002354 [Lerista edwardsae]|nr:hypothetical protein lerEdw1_002354 [Lerista edwardsae]
MYKSLTEVLGALPTDVKVFCGHECTARNLKFALQVEPESSVVKDKLAWAKPFLFCGLSLHTEWRLICRSREETVQKFTGKTDPSEVFAALCRARDSFRKPKERLNPQAMLAFEWGLFDPFLAKK